MSSTVTTPKTSTQYTVYLSVEQRGTPPQQYRGTGRYPSTAYGAAAKALSLDDVFQTQADETAHLHNLDLLYRDAYDELMSDTDKRRVTQMATVARTLYTVLMFRVTA